MILETICKLSCDDDVIIENCDIIKVSLKNGEVLIGEYIDSDLGSLNICRKNSDDINIDFSDVKEIEIV